MIAHEGIVGSRRTVIIALDRTDVGRLLCGTPILLKYAAPDVIVTFIESPQEANRYANELLIDGEKL